MVSTRTKVLTVRVPNELAEAIRRYAERLNRPQSQVVVMMLTEWMASFGNATEEDEK